MTSSSWICPSTGYGPLSNRSEQKTRLQLLGQLDGCLQEQRPEAASYRLKQEQVGDRVLLRVQKGIWEQPRDFRSPPSASGG